MSNSKRINLKKAFKHAKSYRLSANKDSLVQDIEPAFKINGSEQDVAKITAVINRAAKSPTARKTLETASEAGYSLNLVFALGSNGGCMKKEKNIILSPTSTMEEMVYVLVHESRHAGQFERGEYDSSDENRPKTDTIKSEIMRSRATEADAQATAAQACWELFEQDDIGPFRKFNNDSPIIAGSFADVVQKEGFENGKARTAAFKAWYESNRIKTAYENGYNINMMQKHEENGTVGKDTYAKKTSGKQIIDMMCVDEKGGNYFTDDPSIIEQGKYVDICEDTKAFFEEHFAKREKEHGLKRDKTLDELPVRLNDNKQYSFGRKPFHSQMNRLKTSRRPTSSHYEKKKHMPRQGNKTFLKIASRSMRRR